MCSILRESCSKSWRIRVSLDQGPNSAAAASASCEYLLPLRGIFLIKGPSSRHTEGFTERFPFSALVSFLAETHAQKQGGKTSWTTLRLKYLSENCTLYILYTQCQTHHTSPASLAMEKKLLLGSASSRVGESNSRTLEGEKKSRCTFRGHLFPL